MRTNIVDDACSWYLLWLWFPPGPIRTVTQLAQQFQPHLWKARLKVKLSIYVIDPIIMVWLRLLSSCYVVLAKTQDQK